LSAGEGLGGGEFRFLNISPLDQELEAKSHEGATAFRQLESMANEGSSRIAKLESAVEKIAKHMASDNNSAANYENYLQKVEQEDDSAIRQQVYVEHMIHARLVNIDHTLEDTTEICYKGELQIARMLASVATMLRYIMFSLIALGMLLVMSLLVFVARVIILG